MRDAKIAPALQRRVQNEVQGALGVAAAAQLEAFPIAGSPFSRPPTKDAWTIHTAHGTSHRR